VSRAPRRRRRPPGRRPPGRWPQVERERAGANRWPASGPEPVARTLAASVLGLLVLGLLGWFEVWLAFGTYLLLLLTSIVVELGGWSLADRADTLPRQLTWMVVRPVYLIGLAVLELFQIG
jgi:hypothetical protein